MKRSTAFGALKAPQNEAVGRGGIADGRSLGSGDDVVPGGDGAATVKSVESCTDCTDVDRLIGTRPLEIEYQGRHENKIFASKVTEIDSLSWYQPEPQ
jgi:hypothetical protein